MVVVVVFVVFVVVVVVVVVAAATTMSFQNGIGVSGPGKVDAHRRAVFLGPRCTGKTSLIARAVDGKFTEAYTPTIESNMRVWQSRGDQLISITIIDSGGLELSVDDGTVIPPHFCVGIDVYVLVYGVDSISSFQDVQQIFSELVNATGLTLAGMASTTSVILVGMKADVPAAEREVPYNQGDAQAKEWGCKFLECSAKQDVRVLLQRQLDIGHPLSKLMRTPPWEKAGTSASSDTGHLAAQQQNPAPERQPSARLATDLFGASGSAGSTASPGRIQNFGNCLMVFEHLMDTCQNVRQHHGASSFGPSSLPVRSGALTRGSGGSLASSAPSRGNSMHLRRQGTRSSASSLRPRGNSTDSSKTPMLRAQPAPSYGSATAAAAGTGGGSGGGGGGGGGGDGPVSDDGYDDDEFDSDPDFAGTGWGNQSGRGSKSVRKGKGNGKGRPNRGKDRPMSNFVRHSFTLSELYPSSGRCPLCYALCSVKSHQISSAQQVLLVNATKAIAFVILGLSSVSAAGAVLILTVVTSVPDTPNGEGEGPGSGIVISSLQGISAVLAASGAVAALQSVAGNRIEHGRSCLVWLHVVLLVLSILVQMGSFVSFVAGTMGDEAGDGGGSHEPGIRFFRDMLPEGQSSLEVFFFICLVCNVSVETVSTLLAALLKKSIQPTEAAPYNYDEAASPNYNLWTSRGQAGSDGHVNPSTLSRDRIHSGE